MLFIDLGIKLDILKKIILEKKILNQIFLWILVVENTKKTVYVI